MQVYRFFSIFINQLAIAFNYAMVGDHSSHHFEVAFFSPATNF